MKLILHIGMGKTGTTSIQNALKSNTDSLAEQKVHYLGMWFGMISPEYDEFGGANLFIRQDRAVQEEGAETFFQHMKMVSETTGADTFILSNESLFGNAANVEPFITALKDKIEVQLLAYMRDPHVWLPSAYTQWELHHKTHKGPIQPFPQQARKLIQIYAAFSFWANTYPDEVVIRKHDTKIDVVQDFADSCGIVLSELDKRFLVRSEPTEVLLRAAFNTRLPNETLPHRFEAAVLNPRRGITALSGLADLCFKYDDVTAIVDEQRQVFEEIHQKLGPDFNFLSPQESSKPIPAENDLTKRLIDFLVEISFQQGERITKLEKELNEIRKLQ